MLKELIVSVLILAIVLIGNGITESYTRKSVDEITKELVELNEILSKEDIDKDNLIKKIEDIHNNWDDRYEKLAYYLEHDELEKVETELTDVRARINVEEYNEASPEIDKCIFVLEHIKEKNAFCLKNIF